MRILVGTSGYSYKEWKGSFYPTGMKEPDMLRFYAERFGAVEINNTFYRMPDRRVLAHWAAETPETFSFVLKAPRRITHVKRIGDVAADLEYFLDTSSALGPKRGPLLFQLPPFMKKDAERLRGVLGLLPGVRAAFEFRHESWFDEEVYAVLREKGAALCVAETDDDTVPARELPATASWGYARLRRADYRGAELLAWAAHVRSQPWSEAWVFFKHEDEGKGPLFASRFGERLASLDHA